MCDLFVDVVREKLLDPCSNQSNDDSLHVKTIYKSCMFMYFLVGGGGVRV